MRTDRDRTAYLRMYEQEKAALHARLATICEDDYRSRFELVNSALAGGYARGSMLSPSELRYDLVKTYSFAVPCEEALATLSSLGPIIEMGAGTGYWAYLLRKRGVDIQAYDKHPGNNPSNRYKFTKTWTSVIEGRPGKLKKRGNRALFLCWPDYDTDFASRSLECYTGNTVAYIGEGSYGCTGDAAFHTTLDREWDEVANIRLPQWQGIHDELYVYRRKTV